MKEPRTEPFVLNGLEQYAAIFNPDKDLNPPPLGLYSTNHRLLEMCPTVYSGVGCDIEALRASPSGRWIVSLRNSGQGEWGYDVFQTHPLQRVAGIPEEHGYMLELPVFDPAERFLAGLAGEGLLGMWWTHPDDNPDQPSRGGTFTLGFLFRHELPTHSVTRHLLQVNLPEGWEVTDADKWLGPQKLSLTLLGVMFMPPWGVPVRLEWPLPERILLPTPHPSGRGLL